MENLCDRKYERKMKRDSEFPENTRLIIGITEWENRDSERSKINTREKN